ncbi:4-hydroxy-tetrahydrodipicolinate synthase [Fundicoccus culcitae]|uniref:4-hydroxy-tetrahydrodipicolinate synthase n=1 Tax=Fundicoccus culcitae TaxID=2969821 RepID=A0ABY5P5M9_9LACT|nr:4-hydroxy-tetrahydrodipicolinate synthase [Fundicoccus culcitae]UUX34052.1 4-hydroxy-tetrahydrodipicolinate synthase [Fundicoccus culcitae]
MSLFTGSGVAILTPFLPNGEIDWDAYGKLVDFHLQHKTDAIIVTGTTGESVTLTDEEQIKLLQFTLERVDKKVPVIAGTGSNDTAHTIHLSRAAEAVGADGLLVVTPYYNKSNRQGMFLHFASIADSVNIPIILYHVPGRTGVELTVDQVVELSQHPNINGIKDATGDLAFTQAVIENTHPDFAVYSGNDDNIYDVMAIGGQGVISVLANVAPEETHNIVQLYNDGKEAESQALHQSLAGLIESLFLEVNPIPVKYLAHLLGHCHNAYRLPLFEPSDLVKERLVNEAENLSQYIIE